jgi:lipoate-protein ligase B
MKRLHIINLGSTRYKSAWELQQKYFDLRLAGKISDVLLLTEHEHVYTLGKSSDDNHLLADQEKLKIDGVDVYRVDRGGNVTYHGPGQLVGYPILDLNNYHLDIHRYLRDLEEVLIRTVNEYGIKAYRDEKFTGVWVGSDKIAAIGVKVSRWITMHGFALNVNTDLSYFDRIIPCGIFHKGVTSMERLLNYKISIYEVSKLIAQHFGKVFEVSITEQRVNEFLQSLQYPITENAECL